MVSNIFLSFDPSVFSSSITNESFFYIFLGVSLSLLPSFYFVKAPISGWLSSKIATALIPGWADGTSLKLKGLIPALFSIFLFILFFNCVSLLPYVLCNTSHLWVAISLGLPMWASLVFSGWEANPILVSASLVPASSPTVLGPFLAVLETVSILIRPVSLSLRLVVNLAAGHSLLSFVNQAVVSLFCVVDGGIVSGFGGVFMFMVSVGYFLFEIGISFIQAYIITTLLALYANEHPDNK